MSNKKFEGKHKKKRVGKTQKKNFKERLSPCLFRLLSPRGRDRARAPIPFSKEETIKPASLGLERPWRRTLFLFEEEEEVEVERREGHLIFLLLLHSSLDLSPDPASTSNLSHQ